jgi:hypothetical protein
MQLPSRSYYHLDEVATTWGVQIRDLLDFAVGGHLQLSILVSAVHVQTENEEPLCLTGLHPVLAQDIILVVTSGAARIRRLAASATGAALRFADDQHAISIALEHLLISRDERVRFEREAGDIGQAQGPSNPLFLIENDFARVTCNGATYELGLAQAAVVRQLYEAAVSGNPWQPGKALLAGAKSKCTKLVDLFKRKVEPDWRNLILSDGRGLYRLNIPAGVALSSNRAYRKIMRLFRRSHV